MDQKYFAVPFAVSGDVTAVADPVDPTGIVTFTQGWGPNYARDQTTDPLAIPIDRASTNYLMNVITAALAALQRTGIPEWITTANNDGVALPYAMHSQVRYSATTPGVTFETYVSLVDNNIATPGTDATKWQPISQFVATTAQLVAGTDNRAIVTPAGLAAQLNKITGVVGQARNVKVVIAAASASATLTADEIIVESALGGTRACLSTFNQTVNLATVGVNGMDTGTAPTSGFVALYAIFNPTTGASALLATNAATLQPNVYGGANMPAGYTESALLSVWPTNSSKQFIVGFQIDRRIYISNTTILSTTTVASTFTSLSVLGAAPLNARSISGTMQAAFTTTAGTLLNIVLATFAVSTVGMGVQQATVGGAAGTVNTITGTFTNLAVNTGGNIAYQFTVAGGTGQGTTVQIGNYSI